MVGARAAFALGVALGVAPGPAWATPEFPAALTSPAQRVVCNSERGVCYDRQGPSIALTEIFLGKSPAERLLVGLREHPVDRRPGAVFSPAEGIECVFETGPCRDSARMLTGLTAELFGPWPETRNDAASHALVGVAWKWLGSRYSDDSSARPADPSRYVLRLAPNGRVEVRVDCNRAGGHYRLAAPNLTVELTHSTLAACEPGSLETDFRKDLARTGSFFIRNGKLYVELSGDSGTMEFDR